MKAKQEIEVHDQRWKSPTTAYSSPRNRFVEHDGDELRSESMGDPECDYGSRRFSVLNVQMV